MLLFLLQLVYFYTNFTPIVIETTTSYLFIYTDCDRVNNYLYFIKNKM